MLTCHATTTVSILVFWSSNSTFFNVRAMLYEWVINVLQQFRNIRDVMFQPNLFSPTLKRRIIEKTYCQSVDTTPASTYFDKCNSVIFQHEIKKTQLLTRLTLMFFWYLPNTCLPYICHDTASESNHFKLWRDLRGSHLQRSVFAKLKKKSLSFSPVFPVLFCFFFVLPFAVVGRGQNQKCNKEISEGGTNTLCPNQRPLWHHKGPLTMENVIDPIHHVNQRRKHSFVTL